MPIAKDPGIAREVAPTRKAVAKGSLPGSGGESVFYNFYKAYKLVYERIERDLSGAGQAALSPLEMMHRIDVSPEGRLRLLDLARSLVTSPSSVTRMMDKLVKQGLIVRRESELDRRETFAYLTPKGKQQLDKGMKILRKAIEKHFEFALTSPEETKAFVDVLHVLIQGKEPS